ncbi:MAG: GGDEF domain-containing protein, partial [Eggerthellaceae bacterium]|nr:GGDEF domain-containing protein [Eggerthellaceae bacterium]
MSDSVIAEAGENASVEQADESGSAAAESGFTTEEVLQVLSRFLCDYRPAVPDELEKTCEQYPILREIIEIVVDLRLLASALSRGEFHEIVPSRGYVISNLKALQSNLRHLVWQMEQLSQGDFSQRIDFLGNVSESFNAMCDRLYLQNSVLQEMAQYDGLTKLANRQYLSIYLDGLFAAARSSEKTFSVLMVDIDFFKKVNDTYGHDVGDVVLKTVGEYLTHIFRSTDFVARYGGEEFMVVLPDQQLETATMISERVLEHFQKSSITIND